MRRKRLDIDMTPLLDVLFILIIFFVITSSFSHLNLQEVLLPHAKGTPAEKAGNFKIPMVVTILANGTITAEGKEVTLEELKGMARSMDKARPVLIGAHRDVPYGKVIGVLWALQEAGVSSPGLLTEEPR
ncbi:biopolymer transport protein [Thermanaerovibrio velox DSM 12556]|uniref:Biopolymer transport protein n=1 Tax=Thermanaerovibrio velox DSM 12556 TaxID=926567 RepID=H0UNT5_9BACT|nr:biopolymer transporter ExbD [Thermanaerovibrio velox]EHM09421.1 biopolymer transport protein [Thermanaerovibrio velox DSM 12556]